MKRRDGLSSRSLKPPSLFALAITVTIALAAVATVHGNVEYLLLILLRAPDFAIAAVWLLSSFGFGAVIVRRSTLLVDRPLRIITSIAVGLGVESLLTLLLGLLGWINWPVAWGMLAVGCGLALLSPSPGTPEEGGGEGRGEGDLKLGKSFDVRKRPHPNPLPGYRARGPEAWIRWLWLLPIGVLTVDCICALLPPGLLWGDEPNGYDVVEYHLQVPREWYELGRIVPLTHNVFSYFPFNVEMHYLLAIAARHGPWAGMYVAQLMHVAFIALAVLAVYALVTERSRTAATIAAVVMATAPWCGLLGPVAYDEGGLLLWGVLAVGLLLRGNVALAGLMAGFACGAKWTAVPIVLIAAPFAVCVMRVVRWRAVILYVFVALLTVSPWLIRNECWVRNPVFPELTGIFGQAHWSATQVERWHEAHLPRTDQQSVAGRMKALSDQVLMNWRYGFLLLPTAIIAAALTWRDRRTVAITLTAVALAMFWTFFTHLQSRFFVFAIPLAALLIGAAAIKRPILFSITAMIIGISGFGWFMRKVGSMDARMFSLIGIQKLDGLTPLGETPPAQDASVVLIGDAKAFFYSTPSRQLFYRTVFDIDALPDETVMEAWESGAPSVNVVRVIDPGELGRFSRTYFGIPSPPLEVWNMPGPTVEWGGVKH